jgi:hypothetical protein
VNPFRKLSLSLQFHQHRFQHVLRATSDFTFEVESRADAVTLRYQGIASFFTRNYFHAQKCFESLAKSRHAIGKDTNYLAWIYARHNKKEDAITTWCKTLEIEKGNKLAAKALDYIRNKGRDLNLQEDEYFDTLIPARPAYIPVKKLLLLILLITVVALFGTIGLFGAHTFSKWLENRTQYVAPDLEAIIIPDYNPNILDKPAVEGERFSYSEEEVLRKFEDAKNMIMENRAVDAQIELNKLKLSNASAVVKARCDLLQDFILEPDYAIFTNKISFDTFNSDPELYRHVYILWDGRVVNHALGEDFVSFSLVMGNDVDGVINGIMPVKFNKAVIASNNSSVGVFGRLENDGTGWLIEGLYLIKRQD